MVDNAKRRCSICGEPMINGFVIGDGLEYYCSDECLHKEYTEEEYQSMYKEDWAYWTEWEADELDDDTEEWLYQKNKALYKFWQRNPDASPNMLVEDEDLAKRLLNEVFPELNTDEVLHCVAPLHN